MMDSVMVGGSTIRALAPELLLSSGAMVMLLATVWRPQGNVTGAAEGAERTTFIARLGIFCCLVTAVSVAVLWRLGLSGMADERVAADGFRWAIDLIVLVGTAISLALIDADHRRSNAYSPEVPVLMLLAATGMLVLAAARDMMLVFLGIELMSLAVYVLTGVNRRSARGAESAIKYFLLGGFASGFLLYGMALLFGATGSTRLVDIAAWVQSHPQLGAMFIVGLALLLVGMAFKVAAVPFHFWTPDVYDGAPLPVTAFMSACVKTAAFATFARIMIEAMSGAAVRWHPVLWWLAVITMVTGNVLALSQRNLVRMLAYSSVAHAGYLLVSIVANSAAGSTALVFYLASYTIATMGAFAVLIIVNDGQDRSPTLDDLAGLWLTRPGLAISMAVFLFAFLGMPLVGGMGFFAKLYILQAALGAAAPQTVLAISLVLASVVSAAYYLRVVAAMFIQSRGAGLAVPSGTPMARAIVLLSVITVLVLGVYPTPAIRWARAAVVRTGSVSLPVALVRPSPVGAAEPAR